jgi:hypothetical protein
MQIISHCDKSASPLALHFSQLSFRLRVNVSPIIRVQGTRPDPDSPISDKFHGMSAFARQFLVVSALSVSIVVAQSTPSTVDVECQPVKH